MREDFGIAPWLDVTQQHLNDFMVQESTRAAYQKPLAQPRTMPTSRSRCRHQ
jgi:hypothetical protein